MQIDTLRRFAELVEAGSLYQAAKRSDISVQGFSKMVDSVEKELGVALVEKTRSGIQTTPAGERFYQYSKKALEDYDNAIADMFLFASREGRDVPQTTMHATSFVVRISNLLGLTYDSIALPNIVRREERFDRMLLMLDNPSENDLYFAELFSGSTGKALGAKGVATVPMFSSVFGLAVNEQSSLRQIEKALGLIPEGLEFGLYSHPESIRRFLEVSGNREPRGVSIESTDMGVLIDFVRSKPNRALPIDSAEYFALRSNGRVDTEGLVFVPVAPSRTRLTCSALYSRSLPLSSIAQSAMRDFTRMLGERLGEYRDEYPYL